MFPCPQLQITPSFGDHLSRKYLAVFFLCLFASALQAQKPFQNGQAARAVVGQITFTQGSAIPSQQVLGGASGLAWAGNRLYVADSNRIAASPQDHRVLVFDSAKIPDPHRDVTQDSDVSSLVYCYLCGSPSILSLGQDTFDPPTLTSGGTTTQAFYSGRNGTQDPSSGASPAEHAWFNNATAVATDGVRFAVADTDNNRVLLWKALPTSTNQNPDLVLGQPDFATVQQQTLGMVTATTMRGPQGVWIQNNKLYVADTQNHRVLIWNTFPTSNNPAPDVVLGQPDFTHANAPPPTKIGPSTAANQLLNPVAVTADSRHIFVADLGFNRVLIWNTISPGIEQNADVVVGQNDFVGSNANSTSVCPTVATSTTTNAPCAYGLNYPRFALSDGTRLFIADGGNDRVLIYNSIPTANGVAANNVLGQTSFTTDIVTSAAISIVSTQIDNTGAVDTTPTPTSLAWDGTNLYVADPFNRRVLIFSAGDALLPSASDPNASVIPVVNWASEIVRQEGSVVLNAVSTGKITANDTVTVTIKGTAYTYTEKSTDTVDGIAKALVKLINASDANVTATFAGTGTQAIYLSSNQSNLAFDSITLAATTSNSANITATASGSYLSAGNAATVSAGALIEVNAPPGVTFADTATTSTAALGGRLPNQLGGVQLYLDGFASPLLKVSRTQIVGQIPYFYGERNSTSVYVRTVHGDGSVTVTNATPVYIAPANPGIFNAQQFSGQARPWPASMAFHQAGNPTAVVSVDGSVHAGDTATITIAGTSYTYTVVSTDTLASIVTNLVNLIGPDPKVTAAPGGAFTRVVLTARDSGFAGGNGISVATATSSGASVTLTAYTSATCCAVQPGSQIYPANPAVPGELISISTAGLGGISDANGAVTLDTGAPFSGSGLNNVYGPNFVAATMGGQTAQVIYSGLPKGSYGIYRVDLIVPSGLAANDTTALYIAQNAFISNTVSLAVGAAVANPGPPPKLGSTGPIVMGIDSPSSGSTISGVIDVGGWAIDTKAAVSTVSVLVDGLPSGAAGYGGPRPDACAFHPSGISCPNVAFDYIFNTSTLANGVHSFAVTVTDANGARLTTASSNVTVYNNPASYPTHINIDVPFGGAPYHGLVNFGGWALNDTSLIVSFKGAIDGVPINTAALAYGGPRPDVCAPAFYQGRAGCPNVGWSYLADLTKLANGAHTFSLTAFAANGQQFSSLNTFTVNNFTVESVTNGPSISIDTPSASAGTLRGITGLGGWAINGLSAISNVGVSVDGVFFGYAQYGGTRNDVCTAFSNPAGCPNVGWNTGLDTTLLSDGTHTLQITANPSVGQSYTATRTITVGNLGSAANPIRIGIDRPNAVSPNLSGKTSIGGWAISDTSVIQTVTVSVDGVMNGTATYGGPRPDVCLVFPGRAGCPNVAWGYMLDTTRLASGSHMLEVTASTPSGQRATAGMAFTVSNSSSAGTTVIETPGPINHAYSGIAQFSGWAQSASAAIVSVTVNVDGVPIGTASYGDARTDVCPLKPACGWRFAFDTSSLTDGVHTFGVLATAADGAATPASASFTVANWTVVQPTNIEIDTPNGALKTPYSGGAHFGGWLYDSFASIRNVSVSVDGIPFGAASFGGPRPDVCTSTSVSPDCPNVAWDFLLDTTFLSNDVHTLSISATTAAGQSSSASKQFTTAN
jgi:uncharacterized protein (TIGR03437 family)